MLELARHEDGELRVLLHMTRDGAPFAEHKGVRAQMEVTREGFLLALERWRMLVEVDEGQKLDVPEQILLQEARM
jgi:hypothetical protein